MVSNNSFRNYQHSSQFLKDLTLFNRMQCREKNLLASQNYKLQKHSEKETAPSWMLPAGGAQTAGPQQERTTSRRIRSKIRHHNYPISNQNRQIRSKSRSKATRF